MWKGLESALGGMWPWRSARSAGRASRAWRRAAALGAALLLAALVLPRAPPAAARHRHRFPAVQPHRLAHYLADFSNHLLVYPRPESWAIESQWNNWTSWHYEVSYTCGARCVGRAAVTALRLQERGAPQHGAAAARRHRVLARDERCTRLLPPLPWPALCEETETDTLIVGEGEGVGSQLWESAAARCSRLAALVWRCADGAELSARHELRLRALAVALATTTHR